MVQIAVLYQDIFSYNLHWDQTQLLSFQAWLDCRHHDEVGNKSFQKLSLLLISWHNHLSLYPSKIWCSPLWIGHFCWFFSPKMKFFALPGVCCLEDLRMDLQMEREADCYHFSALYLLACKIFMNFLFF